MSIQETRLRVLKSEPLRREGDYVLYWMQQSQRVRFNHALEYAVEEANALGLPVVVCFGLTENYPEANARHYAFMLEGLADLAIDLERRGAAFLVRTGVPNEFALDLSNKAALVVCDRGYMRVQRLWRAKLAEHIQCRLVQVEDTVVVPVETASSKHEYGARTLRPKLHRVWEDYIAPLKERPIKVKAEGLRLKSPLDVSDPAALLDQLKLDRSIGPVRRFKGGTTAGLERLTGYLDGAFAHYSRDRGLPEAGAASHMSPYLHFGQISPVEIALLVRQAKKGDADDKRVYLEELIVRRELAMNHVFYEEHYDSYDAMPGWARETLAGAEANPRPHLYDHTQLAAGKTHDADWNTAMLEMRETGYMHNHMRMYWGKKILEWTASPRDAFETILSLNNAYFLDGRDANSFTNVGWLFGLHDRPWPRRPVFGSVRSMGQASLKKFDRAAYAAAVHRLVEAERQA